MKKMTFRHYTLDNGTGKQGPLRERKEIEFLGYGTEGRHQSQPADLSNYRRQCWEFRKAKTIRISGIKNFRGKGTVRETQKGHLE